jgi:ABC-type branched-subunit amino acid transport system substrate-binding protein
MKQIKRLSVATIFLFVAGMLMAGSLPAEELTPKAVFNFDKFPDMSDFDPNQPMEPGGDTIKIAIVASFSGPAASVGEIYYASVAWAAHTINKQGGLMVDGKKKMVQLLKADGQSKPDITKKVTERMILQEKVDFLWGTNGSHLQKVINQVADKYKKIAVNASSLSDELQEGQDFSRYAFMTTFSTEQIGRTAAYYYGQVRKKEKKFYILCQDYLFGHSMAEAFKRGLMEYYPEAQIVGEDYHKLFLTDFAPYLTKIKASGAEVIYTGDWIPDAANLLKQARQMGITLPFVDIFMNEPRFLVEVGIEGTKGLVNIGQYGTGNPAFKNDNQIKYHKAWQKSRANWKAPYDTVLYTHPSGNIGAYVNSVYWLLSVVERAASTDSEKIIKVWEDDVYQGPSGNVYKMRACDHKQIGQLTVQEYVPPEEQKQSYNIEPYYWFKDCSNAGPVHVVPVEKNLPKADPALCK